jgi:hypothetical protein
VLVILSINGYFVNYQSRFFHRGSAVIEFASDLSL